MFVAATNEERSNELVDVYGDFFSTRMSQIISIDRFNSIKKTRVSKAKIEKLLPYKAVSSLISDINPYEGIEAFSYAEMLSIADKYFNVDNLIKFVY